MSVRQAVAFASGDPFLQVIGLSMSCPPAVRFDPFGTGRHSFRKWQVENADLLALRASAAYCDDLLRRGDIYAFDGNGYTEYLSSCLPWRAEA
jgi:hypothetical protein